MPCFCVTCNTHLSRLEPWLSQQPGPNVVQCTLISKNLRKTFTNLHMPTLYIDEFVGISNRFEALPLAFAIQHRFGHRIVLDWAELDSFRVEGTTRGKVRPWTKLGAIRVRNCDLALFNTLGDKKIICRSLDGPDEFLDPIYLDVARKVKAADFVIDGIERAFAPFAGRPVVAVHIRQGDYHMVSTERYDIGAEWPAVPVWWYAAAMRKVLALQPNAVFFVAHNGGRDTLQALFDEFPTFQLDLKSPYDYKGPDHQSAVNPVADLFALACCPVLLATPVSGYSHWAANAMGEPSVSVVPLPGCTEKEPAFGKVDLFGSRMPRWRAAGRTGSDTVRLDETWTGVELSQPASLAWLRT